MISGAQNGADRCAARQLFFGPPAPGCGENAPADSGATEWTQELWKRARARFYPIARYAAHPVVSKALAFCRPCDSSMTKPRTEELGAGISVWTNREPLAHLILIFL
eukprot:scaffold4750_cov140-Isochrysis_galbana.AAC.6